MVVLVLVMMMMMMMMMMTKTEPPHTQPTLATRTLLATPIDRLDSADLGDPRTRHQGKMDGWVRVCVCVCCVCVV